MLVKGSLKKRYNSICLQQFYQSVTIYLIINIMIKYYSYSSAVRRCLQQQTPNWNIIQHQLHNVCISTTGLVMKHGWRQGHRLEKESDGVIIINKQAQLSLDPTSLVC